nr:MAG TPA: hypothetical protein [Caudoviricetes sp.]
MKSSFNRKFLEFHHGPAPLKFSTPHSRISM